MAVLAAACVAAAQPRGFVAVRGGQLIANGRPYRFVGTNYWYGGLLGLETDKRRGIERLRHELDFLKAQGVTNLRLMAGAEGLGLLNGVTRVGPPLQPEQGKFDREVLVGLDIVLAEMRKRNMRAVIFLSNNWEWSGGWQQYLIWNSRLADKWLSSKPTWDELRDNVSKFYTCTPCADGYAAQARFVITRTNTVTKKRYTDDPTIMAWEIANEPRPMRPAANDAYKSWLAQATALVRSLDKKHLITLGHEGSIGTESIELYEQVHADKNVDYLTIHIWPKNWGWFENRRMPELIDYPVDESVKYIKKNAAVAAKLKKPLVIEEFGLPRDGQSYDPASTTSLRNTYYVRVLSFIVNDRFAGADFPGKKNIVGANFWAFGGTAKPIKGQPFWKPGDQYMGDPPMEEQGLNSVFDSDESTWKLIRSMTKGINAR